MKSQVKANLTPLVFNIITELNYRLKLEKSVEQCTELANTILDLLMMSNTQKAIKSYIDLIYKDNK